MLNNNHTLPDWYLFYTYRSHLMNPLYRHFFVNVAIYVVRLGRCISELPWYAFQGHPLRVLTG